MLGLGRVSEEKFKDKLGNVMLPYFQNRQYKRRFGKSQHIPRSTTNQCSKQSMNMSRMINQSADPCTSFYEYACGGWIAEGLPNGQAQWTIFSCLEEQMENKMKSLIEKQKHSESSVEKLVYNWYASCMDQEERDKLGAEPLKKLIRDTMGQAFNFSFVGNISFKNEEDWKLEDVLAAVHRIDVFPLFAVTLDADQQNSSSPALLSITPPEPLQELLGDSSQTAQAATVAKAYGTLMRELTRLMGATSLQHEDHTESFTKELERILSLEVKVVGFNWTRYFSRLTEGLNEYPISDSEEIYVEDPGGLTRLLRLVNDTDKSVIAHYITWYIIDKYGQYISSDFHDAYTKFARQAYGEQRSSEFSRRCVRHTDQAMEMGVSRLLLIDRDSGFTQKSVHHVDRMVQKIREAFIENLESVTWMDSETKLAAKEKAEAILQLVGYPHFIANRTLLEEYYAGLEIDPKNFFGNVLAWHKLVMESTLLSRGQPFSRSSWDMPPSAINAYYSPNFNKIVVPSGIIRSRFYNSQHLQ
ncbi:hypothetical protein ACROYT_G023915 [Oculina patagonica]